MNQSGEFIKQKYKSSSPRLSGWNYSTPAVYFITICTSNHNNFFGKIVNAKMQFKPAGEICHRCLHDIPKHFSNIKLLEWIIMPNHIHFLLRLVGSTTLDKTLANRDLPVETHHGASLQDNRKITLIKYGHKNHPNYYPRLTKKSNQTIPVVVNQFKSSVKRIAKHHNLYFSWQPRYFDEIVFDKDKLFQTKNYIINNPRSWKKDKYFSLNAHQN